MTDEAVPLVAYLGGERVELGTAVVRGDGTIEASLDPDKMTPETKRLFSWSGAYSIAVEPKKEKPKCPMHGCTLHH